MATVTEIAPDVFRISTYVAPFDLQFNQFLVRDDEPLLFHTGLRALLPAVREAVASLIEPAALRWISFSHFEADECGSLNDWLTLAPKAQTACSFVGAAVSVDDVSLRPARALQDGETFSTGNKRYRFLHTPHVPHCWEAGMLFEESTATLFCSDLLDHGGDVEPLTESDVVGRHRDNLLRFQQGPFANYMPWTPNTEPTLRRLADLQPRTLAIMHGSAFRGDGRQALIDEIQVLREIFGSPAAAA
jgi:flavorubredoxin